MERQSWCSHQSPVPIPLLFIILAATDTLLQVHRISLFLRIVGIVPSRFVATPDASAKPKGRPVTKQPSSYGSSTRLYNTVLRVLAFAKSSLAHLSVVIRLDIHRRKMLQNSIPGCSIVTWSPSRRNRSTLFFIRLWIFDSQEISDTGLQRFIGRENK